MRGGAATATVVVVVVAAMAVAGPAGFDEPLFLNRGAIATPKSRPSGRGLAGYYRYSISRYGRHGRRR